MNGSLRFADRVLIKSRARQAMVLAAGAMLLGMGSAEASVWTGGTAPWTSNVNPGWNGTGVPDAQDAVADFTALTGAFTTITGNFRIGTFIGPSTGKTFNGGPGTLIMDSSTGTATIRLGTSGQFITFNNSFQLDSNLRVSAVHVPGGSTTHTFNGAIADGANGPKSISIVNVDGAGTAQQTDLRILLDSASSTFSGGVSFGGLGQQVTLRLGHGAAAGTGQISRLNTNGISAIVFTRNMQTFANDINFGTSGGAAFSPYSFGGGVTEIRLNGVLSGTMNNGRSANSGGTMTLGGTSPNVWTGAYRHEGGGTLILDKAGAISTLTSVDLRTEVTSSRLFPKLLANASDTIAASILTSGDGSGTAREATLTIGGKAGFAGTVTFDGTIALNLTSTDTIAPGFNPGRTNLILTADAGALINFNQPIITNGIEQRNVEKTGEGTVAIGSVSNVKGNVTVSAGKLVIGTGNASATLGVSATTEYIIASPTATLAYNLTGSPSIGNGISGPGSFEQAGTGTVTLNGAIAPPTYTGETRVVAGKLMLTTALTASTAVSVAGGATLELAGGPAVILRTSSLTLAPGSVLNVNDHDVIIDYSGSSPIAELISAFLDGRLVASGDFLGLPTYLAIAEAEDLGLTEYAGLGVDDTTVIAKFTYVGDANLDGQVDALDYERVDLAIGNTGVAGTSQGDLNYDGTVDALDYEQIDLNIGNGVGSPLGGDVGAVSGIIVPEPSSLALLVAAIPLVSRRRR